jgi:hypothetical protein
MDEPDRVMEWTRYFVSNLPFDTNPDILKEWLEEHVGPAKDVEISTRVNGRSKLAARGARRKPRPPGPSIAGRQGGAPTEGQAGAASSRTLAVCFNDYIIYHILMYHILSHNLGHPISTSPTSSSRLGLCGKYGVSGTMRWGGNCVPCCCGCCGTGAC